MHVALLAPAWPPATHPNGIVTYVRWMRQGLLGAGCRVSVFAWSIDPGHDEADTHLIETEAPPNRLSRLMSRLRGKSAASVFESGGWIAGAFAKVHAKEPIDVIEMEESFGWAKTVQDRLSIPVVVKLHGPAFLHLVDEELATPFGREKVTREGAALARLPFITSPSQCHLDDTLARYALHPAIAEHIVNPLAVDTATPLWDSSRCEANILLFVGRFDKVKGGDLVVLAFQALLRRNSNLRLVFVGPDRGLIQPDGGRIGLAAFIASLDDPLLSRAVIARGPLDPSEIAVLRTQAACTFVASRRESQGYTALEAMLQGCPVVCTDSSGLAEIVKHGVTGLKARSGDAADLARQLQRVLDDPALGSAIGQAARRHVFEHHDPGLVAAKTLAVYRQAMASRAGHPQVGVGDPAWTAP